MTIGGSETSAKVIVRRVRTQGTLDQITRMDVILHVESCLDVVLKDWVNGHGVEVSLFTAEQIVFCKSAGGQGVWQASLVWWACFHAAMKRQGKLTHRLPARANLADSCIELLLGAEYDG